MIKRSHVFVPAALAVVGLLGWWAFGTPAKAPAQERPRIGPVVVAPPIKWEYKLIAYHPVLENMEKELDRAGNDGWEAVGTASGAVQHVIMKRPHR